MPSSAPFGSSGGTFGRRCGCCCVARRWCPVVTLVAACWSACACMLSSRARRCLRVRMREQSETQLGGCVACGNACLLPCALHLHIRSRRMNEGRIGWLVASSNACILGCVLLVDLCCRLEHRLISCNAG